MKDETIQDIKVTYLDHMGGDLTVVNAARVSFGKTSNELTEADKNLIGYLARGMTKKEYEGIIDDLAKATTAEEVLRLTRKLDVDKHFSPFTHPVVSVHVNAPIFVARQLFRHTVGLTINEESRRYVDNAPSIFMPETWRKRPDKSIKQGSGGDFDTDDQLRISTAAAYTMGVALGAYEGLIETDLAPEQARMILPQAMMTQWVWTGSLAAWARVYNQRSDSHAQKESQEFASQLGSIVEPLFPVSWEALTRG